MMITYLGIKPEGNSEGSFVNKIYDSDKNFSYDIERMNLLGIVESDIPEMYWLASRFIERSTYCAFSIQRFCHRTTDWLGCNASDSLFGFQLRSTRPSAYVNDTGLTAGVRPVITLSKDCQLGNGDGSESNPLKVI